LSPRTREEAPLASGNRFGTFGGVFTPSILTILGVIMYLRLPLVVHDGGLVVAVAIIAAAHLISVTTGLSVSSIATDKRVEAGGAYYIISRSMGLAMGGTLGLALFAGLSFSISLYIIGFSESFLRTFELGLVPAVGDGPATVDPNVLRLCGTLVLVALTVLTFISTSLAIRAQYLILAAIALSIGSILLGGTADAAPVEPRLWAPPDASKASELFGIFFPAVTGFTAGVNLSGDLKDPRRSIPVGTLLAIGVGMLVYIGLAVYCAVSIPPELLADESSTFENWAISPELVRAGIWGATLSSALGSILGAPRILQALSLDKITPRIFGLGHGRTNEPRYALVLAFAIALVGILIGELNAVAQIVSVFFIATYGFLNLSASFEMIASPDFRPEFKIPVAIPILGAAACAVLMIWLDLFSMLLAALLMTGLFFVLKRRELQLETGDALLGVWSSVVRVGLQQLTRESEHQRNWRPNLLLFTKHDADSREPLIEFGESLIRHRGVATEFLLSRRDETLGVPLDRGAHEGFFHRSAPVDGDPYTTMAAVCRFHGFSGLEPNTVMIDWHDHARDPRGFSAFLDTVRELDLNLLALAFDAERGFGRHEQIDLWFSYESGFLPLHLALIRFISSSDEWRRAKLRFLAIHDEPGVTDAVHRTTTQALVDSRIEAQVKVIDNSVLRQPHAEFVVQHSAKADLTVIGMSDPEIPPDRVDELESMVRQIGVALFVRGSSTFTAARTIRHAPRSPTPIPGPNRLPQLILPSIPALAQPAARFSVAHQQLVQRFVEAALRPVFDSQTSLLVDVRQAIAELYEALGQAVQEPEVRTSRFENGPCSLYAALAEQLDTYVTTELPQRQATLERAIELFVEGIGPLRASVPRRIVARRPVADFARNDADRPWRRRYKARRRFWASLTRRKVLTTRLRTRRLLRFHVDHRTRQWLDHALRDAASRSLQFSTDLGGLFNTLRDSLAVLTARALDRSLSAELVEVEAERLTRHLENFGRSHQLACDRLVQRWLSDARAIQQTLATDLGTIGFARHVRSERRPPRGTPRDFEGFDELPAIWTRHQRLTLMRARLVPVVAEVQTRVVAAVRRTRHTVRRRIDARVAGRSQDLAATLATMAKEANPSEQALVPFEFADDTTVERRTIDELRDELEAASETVPPTMDVITDDALSALQSDPFSEIEVVEIGLRRRFQFLVDGELVAPMRDLLADVPREMARATTNAEDVVKLVRFTLTESDQDGATSEDALEPVLKASIERLESDLHRLRQFDRALGEQVEERLEQVLDLTNGFALLGTVEALAQGQRRTSTLGLMGAWPQRLARWVREALVSLAYRRSATVLLARRVQGAGEPRATEGVLALVEAFSPDPVVIEALPSFYTQLFSTQSTLHSAFWVDREREVQRLEQAIVRYGRGFHGAIVITGDPGAGKTALCEVAIERLLQGRPIVRVTPPSGGSCDPAVFRRALQVDLKRRGSIEDLVGSLDPGSVVVMVDAQLWWERSAEGTAVLERISDLVERFGDRVLFVIEMASPTLRFLQQYSAFGLGSLDTIECGPVDARTLKEIVLQRHASTGLRFSLDGRRDDELSDLAVAQLFTRHFDHTGGNIAAALQSWLAHIEHVEAEQLAIVSPGPFDDDALDVLDGELVAILLQLVLHKGMSVEGLERVSGQPRADLQRHLASLRRAGLVQLERRNVVRLQPRTQHLVLRSALRRGLLP